MGPPLWGGKQLRESHFEWIKGEVVTSFPQLLFGFQNSGDSLHSSCAPSVLALRVPGLGCNSAPHIPQSDPSAVTCIMALGSCSQPNVS